MPAIEDNGPEVAAILNGAGFQIPTDAQFTEFQTAFGWGDHSTAGYLTSAPVASVAGLTGTVSASALRTALNVADGADVSPVASVAGLTGTVTASGLRTAINVADGATANTGALADLNSVDTAQIDNAAVTIAKLSATGTASSSTFLRGDGTWGTPAGGGGGITWSTAVDADIIPDGNNTRDLGTDAARFAQVHTQQLFVAGNEVTSVADPNQDAIAFWNDSISSMDYLLTMTGLTIVGDAISVDTIQTAGLADDAVTMAKINATGTASASTYLRGDGSWATPSGGGAVDSVAGLTGVITDTGLRTAINVEDGAAADQTGSEIATLLDTELGSGDWRLGGGGAVAVQANALTNAGFETGDATGWTVSTGTANVVLVTSNAGYATAGATAARNGTYLIEGGSQAAFDIYQDVDVSSISGTAVIFASLDWIGDDGVDDTITLRVEELNSSSVVIRTQERVCSATAFGYEVLSFFFLKAAAAETVRFHIVGNRTVGSVLNGAADNAVLSIFDYSAANPEINLSEVVTVCLFDGSEDVTTGDAAGDQLFRVPSKLNGWNLTGVAAYVETAGATGATTVQVHNVTDTADMLSTAMTIDTGETDTSTAATAAVIDAANDDVATGDKIRFDVDTVSTGTAPQGLWVELTFEAP